MLVNFPGLVGLVGLSLRVGFRSSVVKSVHAFVYMLLVRLREVGDVFRAFVIT